MKSYSLLLCVFFLFLFFCITPFFIPFAAIIASDAHSNGHDVHAVIETSRSYMDHTRNFTDEYWLTDNKICIERGNRISITRKDLGLIWSIDLEEKTYSERKIEDKSDSEKKKEDKLKHREIQKEDIHSLGFDYEPDYEWEIKETDETKDISGFPCCLFLAEGDADFSEIILKFWVCTESQFPGAAELHNFMIERLENDMERKPILEILKKYKNSFLVHYEQIIDGPIARTIRYDTSLVKLEMTDAPQNIYDLPQGLKKLGKNE